MLNFTVGPVQSCDEVRHIGSQQVPYFRTHEFSQIMFENEELVKKFAGADNNARVCFMTSSGTGSMEAVVCNCFDKSDKLIVINGGSFGHRFEELTEIYDIPHHTIHLDVGKNVTEEMLAPLDGKDFTGFLVNVHETSTGVHYDIELIADFCRRNNLFLVVDAISSFLCDEFNMKKLGVGVMITGSQKALACPPGISIIVLSQDAIKRVFAHKPACMYFDLKLALKNGERGQTPFTPAVNILLQINARLKQIDASGGIENEIQRCADLANDFRDKIKDLPFEIVSESLSNAVTPLHPINSSAYDIFRILKDDYGIWICPNGGDLKDSVFRVGHIGYLSLEDNDRLISALNDLIDKGIIK